MLETISVPKRDIISDVLPVFILLVLVLPLAEEAFLIQSLFPLDIPSTILMYIVFSFVLYPLVFPIREIVGVKIFRYLDRKVSRDSYVKLMDELIKEIKDPDEFWDKLPQTIKDNIQDYQAYGFMYLSLFYVFLIYIVSILIFQTKSPSFYVPVLHLSIKINIVIMLLISISAAFLCFYESHNIFKEIFQNLRRYHEVYAKCSQHLVDTDHHSA
jgi:hypothetical protein